MLANNNKKAQVRVLATVNVTQEHANISIGYLTLTARDASASLHIVSGLVWKKFKEFSSLEFMEKCEDVDLFSYHPRQCLLAWNFFDYNERKFR